MKSFVYVYLYLPCLQIYSDPSHVKFMKAIHYRSSQILFHIQHSCSRILCKTIFKGRVGRSERPERETQELHKYKSYHVRDDHCLLNHGDYRESYKLG